MKNEKTDKLIEIIRFIPKHIGWRRSIKKDIRKFNNKDLFQIYEKYKEVKEKFQEAERHYYSTQYFDKTKVDKEYHELKGWFDCLTFLREVYYYR